MIKQVRFIKPMACLFQVVSIKKKNQMRKRASNKAQQSKGSQVRGMYHIMFRVCGIHNNYVDFAHQTGHMLNNVSANTIAGRELEAMSSAMKSNLVPTLDKSLNTSVNKVR
jgi:hypothetical protein